MKSLVRVVLLVMIAAGVSSCEKIRNLFDVEIDTTIEGDLSFVTDDTELKSTEDYGFDASATVEILNEDLSDYDDLIKDFKTKSITVTVESIDSAGHEVTGIILRENTRFEISSTTHPGYYWQITSDMPISPGFNLSLDAASYDAINEVLGDYTVPVTFSTEGSCNKGNIHIVLNYDIEVTVKSNPL